ncbi:hypothetical protein IFM89_010144 [Coptis chinensis]|uniref:Uncharacterized protein n=1 Tax=Coptis chinensis TaxID=261450 RepID=A0A835M280_9MAGN|nr:hypothetical protein IFM89_010144 [Coptis chinensis]
MNQPMIAEEPVLLSLTGILEKALEIRGKSKRFIVSNMLLIFLPFCLLVLGADLTFAPVMGNVVTLIDLVSQEDPNSSGAKKIVEEILKSVWLMLGLEILFLSVYCTVSLFSVVATRHTSSRAILNMKDLFSKTSGSWKRQVITWVYVTFLVVVLVAIILISIGVLPIRVTGVATIALSLMFVILITLCYLYLAAIWIFSIVLTIMEINLNEPMILQKFEELNKGRRLQGFVLMLFASIVSIVMVVAFAFERRKINQGIDTQLANGIMMLCYVCLLKLFMLVLYSVFYNESKRRNGEQVEEETRLSYAPLVASEV